MKIIKSTGEKETFDKIKFSRSLKKAGTSEDVILKICKIIESGLRPGMTTSQIFRKTLTQLVKHNIGVASRYNLKRSMALLGPSGFLFEQYLEALLRSLGYKTLRNQIMQGKCVEHEIDVVAKKDGVHYLIEAKYHNNPGIKTSVDVIMYADARLRDITFFQEKREIKKNVHQMWLITNTKFTSQTIKYAVCQGLKLTSWNYPLKDSLHELIEKASLYPITALPSVDTYSREQFVKYNMILAQDISLYSASDLVKKFKIDRKRAEKIAKEAKGLVYEKA